MTLHWHGMDFCGTTVFSAAKDSGTVVGQWVWCYVIFKILPLARAKFSECSVLDNGKILL